jgi:hypothetical protein
MSANQNQHESKSAGKSLLEKRTLQVTIASTVVAIVAMFAAFWSVWEAHWTRVEDDRPVLTAGPPDPQPELSPYLPIIIKNFGKSTATQIKVSFRCPEESAPVVWSKDDEQLANDTYTYIYPDTWVLIRCPNQGRIPPSPNATIVELGVIHYQDLAHHKYISPFCLQFTRPPQWAAAGTKADVIECSDNRNLPTPE